jgi:glyoxylase-like metal-dependent hydrolase (beta-lactamase superfamily II)
MKIGDITIEALIDGETAYPGEFLYTNKEREDWTEHEQFLDPCTGNYVNTLGGFLIRSGDRVIVLDTGIGSKPIYPWLGGGFRSSLLSKGVAPEDVTDVVFSHLHLDHIGWAAQHGKPFFSNATYRCDRRDWDFFVSPDYEIPEWESSTSNPAEDSAANRLAPVASRMEFFEGEQGLFPGISTLESSGHTPGSTVLLLESGGEKGLLLGDLVHSEPELYDDNWDFVNHVDHDAGRASIEKIRKLILDEVIPFAAAHFTGMRWGHLTRNRASDPLGYEALPE